MHGHWNNRKIQRSCSIAYNRALELKFHKDFVGVKMFGPKTRLRFQRKDRRRRTLSQGAGAVPPLPVTFVKSYAVKVSPVFCRILE